MQFLSLKLYLHFKIFLGCFRLIETYPIYFCLINWDRYTLKNDITETKRRTRQCRMIVQRTFSIGERIIWFWLFWIALLHTHNSKFYCLVESNPVKLETIWTGILTLVECSLVGCIQNCTYVCRALLQVRWNIGENFVL